MIQTVLRAQLPANTEITITGAGTAVRWPRSWPQSTITTLRAAGYGEVSGRTRRLTGRQVRQATLIITASRAHRGEALALDPTAELRCFTLLESARLLTGLTPATGGILSSLQTALAAERGEHDDDLDDPAGGSDEDFLACLQSVQAAVAVLVGSLSSPPPPE